MAQLVLGVAGAAIGGTLGPLGAQIGFALGSAAGASLQTQKQYGPKLTDLRAPAAAYGSVIPYLEGSMRVPGVYAWASDKREIANTASTGGKGGPSVESTSYTYEMDALVLLAENEISGVRRIWANGKLIWSAASDATLETILASGASEYWTAIRFYTGNTTQMPDSTYEAAVGIGNAPGYRGRAYAFIEGLNLGGSGQLPALTFEVYVGQVRSMGPIETATVTQSMPGGTAGTAAFVDVGVMRVSLAQWTNTYATSAVKVYDIDVLNGTSVEVGNYNVFNQNYRAYLGGCTSDVPMFGMHFLGTIYGYTGTTGAETIWTNADTTPFRRCFARLGDDIVFGGRGGGTKQLYRHATSGGTALATSAVLPLNPSALCIAGDKVYAASAGGETVYELDLETLTLLQTLNTPLFGTGSDDSMPSLVTLDGEPCLFCSATGPGGDGSYPVYAWRGEWVLIGNGDATFGLGDFTIPSLVVAGSVLIGADVLESPSFHYRVRYAGLLSVVASPQLSDVAARQCERAGLTTTQYDTSALTGEVFGFAVTQLSTPRAVLEMLTQVYHFDGYESGGKLKFAHRGQAPVATIAYDDLGASAAGRVEPLPLVRVNDLELPAQVVVRYSNHTDDYRDGVEASDRLVSSLAGAVEAIELPLALAPQEARRVADVRAAEIVTSFMRTEGLALDTRYVALEPTDVITVVDEDGATQYRMRVLRIRDDGMVRQLDATLDDVSAITSVAVTDANYTESSIVLVRSDTTSALLDIPILRDADDDSGHYAAVTKASNTGSWPGATLLRGENDANYESVATYNDRTYIGTTVGTLAAPLGGAGVFDESRSVSVTGFGTLESWTRGDILEGLARPLLLGNEVVFYRTATNTGTGAYTVSGLLRGQRGTEWAMSTHTAGERAVLLQPAGLRRVQTPTTKIGVALDFKAVTTNSQAAGIVPTSFANTSIGLRPFAPVDARFSTADGTPTVSWVRRTRKESSFTGPSGSSVPLGEDTEAYEVDILTDSPLTVVATVATTTPLAALSTAAALTTLARQVYYTKRRSDGTFIAAYESSVNTAWNLVRFDSSGAAVETSPVLGSSMWDVQLDTAGDVVYAQAYELDSFGAIVRSKLYRFAATNLTAPTATYDLSFSSGDFKYLWWDGSAVWSLGYRDNKLRKHGATSLAVTQTITITPPTGTGAFYGQDLTGGPGGDLLVTMMGGASFTRQVVRISPAGSPSEPWRTTFTGNGPYGRGATFAVGSPIATHYVVGLSGGFLIVDADDGSIILNQAGDQQGLFGIALSASEFAVLKSSADNNVAEVRSALDGSLVRQFVVPTSHDIVAAEPVEGTFLAHTLFASASTEYAQGTSPVGGVVRIYQMSATYGRGLPLEAVVPAL
jgi:hypothetical protein